MVHNTANFIKLPFGGHTLMTRNRSVYGRGMGSVLLETGGGGAASSYMDMDDYIHTTGRDPYAAKTQRSPRGKGISSLTDKLRNMAIVPTSSRRKNITMSM